MTTSDQSPVLELVERRPRGPTTAADFAAAAQLVSDLEALVEAGLIVVRRPLGGPARYAISAELDGAA